MLVPFVDISHYQGNVNFPLMASRGVKAVLCKVTEGGAEDPKWRQYAHDSRAAGLACGGYHFVNTGSSFGPEGQADRFVAAVNAVGPPLMLHMYDMEWSGVVGSLRGAALAAYYVRCVNRADSQLGRKGSIYTIRSFWRDYTGNSPALADHDLIVATARGGIPPTDASHWDDWFTANGGIMAPKYYPIVPWADWAACQFAVPSGIGPTYGVQSSALDLDVCKPDAYARWTGQIVEPDLPLDTNDLAKITAIVQTEVAKAIAATNGVPSAVLNSNVTVPVTGGPSVELTLETLLGYVQRNCAETVLGTGKWPTSVNVSLANLATAETAAAIKLQNIIDELDGLAPGTGGQDLTKVHLDSIPGHLQVDP